MWRNANVHSTTSVFFASTSHTNRASGQVIETMASEAVAALATWFENVQAKYT